MQSWLIEYMSTYLKLTVFVNLLCKFPLLLAVKNDMGPNNNKDKKQKQSKKHVSSSMSKNCSVQPIFHFPFYR